MNMRQLKQKQSVQAAWEWITFSICLNKLKTSYDAHYWYDMMVNVGLISRIVNFDTKNTGLYNHQFNQDWLQSRWLQFAF